MQAATTSCRRIHVPLFLLARRALVARGLSAKKAIISADISQSASCLYSRPRCYDEYLDRGGAMDHTGEPTDLPALRRIRASAAARRTSRSRACVCRRPPVGTMHLRQGACRFLVHLASKMTASD